VDSQLPFVSCVCIAGKTSWHDEFMLPAAVHWFQAQAYPANRRDLVIVSDGETNITYLGRYAHIAWIQNRCLGALRNYALGMVPEGNLVAQWDCDEIFHPLYLSTLVDAAIANPGNPVFLQRELAYDFETDTACVRDLVSTFIHGSILHPKTAFRYPEIAKCEDTEFLKNWRQGSVVDANPCLKVHLSHGHNTWDRKHVLRAYDSYWGRGRWSLHDEHRAYLREALTHYHLPSDAAQQKQPDHDNQQDHAAAHAP
jgi:hypothetical protein